MLLIKSSIFRLPDYYEKFLLVFHLLLHLFYLFM